jgi:hypothetical protein
MSFPTISLAISSMLFAHIELMIVCILEHTAHIGWHYRTQEPGNHELLYNRREAADTLKNVLQVRSTIDFMHNASMARVNAGTRCP